MDDNTEQPTAKKLNIWLPLLLAFAMVIGMFVGTRLQEAPVIRITPHDLIEEATHRYHETGRIEELIRYVESRYVDQVNSEELVENAINTILSELDPHSNYISSKELQEVNEQLEGNFEGVGIEFLIVEDTILVVTPIVGGPSETAGILAGDKIVQIEDSLVAGQNITNDAVIEKLKGKAGSSVKITVLRGSDLHSFTITRDRIPIHSVDIATMLDKKTGYLKITRFSATTYKEVMEGLEKLVEEEGMKDLVIDLRQNPGGYLQEATNILSQLFKEKDRLLVYTEGRTVDRNDYKSTGRSFFDIGKIVVLIDEGSASASEIIAGALQDWDRAWIVGRRSFGKGLVQEQYNLSGGAALRLTVARYYTPSGRSIQKPYVGVSDYDSDVVDRYESGELLEEDSNFQNKDTTVYKTAAGRIVFGGGGISPDVFVPLDTVLYNKDYILLRQHAAPFVYRFISNHPDELVYKDLNNFRKNFQVNDQMLQEYLKYAAERGAKVSAKNIMKVKSEVKEFLKSRIARQLFGEEGFYKTANDNDDMVQVALGLINGNKPLVKEQKLVAPQVNSQ
jgi:carboxyl-terminal processing protease